MRLKAVLIGISALALIPETVLAFTADPNVALWSQRICMSVASAFGLFALPPGMIIEEAQTRFKTQSDGDTHS